MKRIAIHQPNFIPWFPFFYKMAMADIFVLLRFVQFEKNGFQNRYMGAKGRWVTKPVNSGTELIYNKRYASGRMVCGINEQWIRMIAETLEIRTPIIGDLRIHSPGTQGLIEIVKEHGGHSYLTNPTAKDKYLQEDEVRAAGLEIEYCNVPKHLQKHTFEILDEYGIEGAMKQLPRRACAESKPVL